MILWRIIVLSCKILMTCLSFSFYPVYKVFLKSYTMTLTFHQWPWIKVMIKVMAPLWVQCNNSFKYYFNSWTQWKVMARTMSKTTMGIVTLTFDKWPWINVVTFPWVQCNNSVKYYSNTFFQWKLMAQTMFKPLWA
jgi:hypothetical protein